ncbi:MAG: glycoside hydrolase family 43 protein [Polyangiaceae bacterium]
MRTRLLGVAGGVGVLLCASAAEADYPVMSHRYLADPGSMVYDGRIYLYNSNDDDNAVGGDYTMHSIVCVSTSDLKNWTDHGIVFSVPANASWAQNSWAPQPITREGKIFLFFGNSASGVGVASSSNPIAGFQDAKGSYLVNSSTPGASGTNSWLFDPGALIDEDGQAYLSFGGNGETNARIIKLGSDLASVSGTAAQLAPKGFYEASFLFKRKATYYFAYSTNSANGLRIDYLTSSSPMSGYTYRGVIADQPPINENNNHASEFEFKGQWYHAYHNRTVSTAAGISTTYKRNLAIEELNFKDDGSIVPVAYTTDGVKQIANLNPYARVEGETFNAQSGLETEVCAAGGMDVTQIDNGDWLKVRGVDFGTAGAKSFTANVASAATGGNIELHLASLTGALVGTCSVPATGGAQTWLKTSCEVTGATGVNDLVLKFTGSGAGLFNLDYWQFAGNDGGTGGSGAGGAAGAGGATAAGGSSGASGASGVAGAGGSEVAGAAAIAGAGGAIAAAGAATAGGAGTPPGGSTPPTASEPSGCSCAQGKQGRAPAAFGVGLGLVLVAARRRRRSS